MWQVHILTIGLSSNFVEFLMKIVQLIVQLQNKSKANIYIIWTSIISFFKFIINIPLIIIIILNIINLEKETNIDQLSSVKQQAPKMSSKFRNRSWDPILIISQIISMQFQFYSTLLFCNYFSNQFVNLTNLSSETVQYSLSQIFDHRQLNFKSAHNTFICFSFIGNSLIR